MAATISGPSTTNSATFDVDPGQATPADAGQAALDAKAAAKAYADKEDASFDANLKSGVAAEENREAGLGTGSGLGIASLTLADGVAKTGLATLMQILAVPSTAQAVPQEVNSQQALADFSALTPLLGKPQGGVTEPLFETGPGALPLVPVGGQVQLLALANSNAFTSTNAPAPSSVSVAKSARSETSAASTAAAAQADPEIVTRVQFVQRLSALMQRTFAAQLDPNVSAQVATELGKKSVGVLQPFAEQMPVIQQAVAAAFSAMGAQAASDVEVPPQSLSLIEGAVGKAFGKADAFVAQVKANSDKILPILQKLQEGDTSALSSASPQIKSLVQGVMSWNSSQPSAFPGTGLGGVQSAQKEASGNSIVVTDTTTTVSVSTGSAQFTSGPSADPLGGLIFSSMDINALIFLVMNEASDEQTSELEDTMNNLQQNTLAKQAQRQKEEALQTAQANIKTKIDNEYYTLIDLGPAKGGILPTVTMTQFEAGCVVNWGDGSNETDANGNLTGNWQGPTPSWQLPDRSSPQWQAWTTPAAAPGTTSPTSAAGGYGLSSAQYQDLSNVYASITPAPSATLDDWLQENVGLTYPVTSIGQATKNLSAAQKYLAKNGGAATTTTTTGTSGTTGGTPITSSQLTDPTSAIGKLLVQLAEAQALTAAGAAPTDPTLTDIQNSISNYLSHNSVDPGLAKKTGGLYKAMEAAETTYLGQAVSALQTVAGAMKGVLDPGNWGWGQHTTGSNVGENTVSALVSQFPDGTPQQYNGNTDNQNNPGDYSAGVYGTGGITSSDTSAVVGSGPGWLSTGLVVPTYTTGSNNGWATAPIGGAASAAADPTGMIAAMQKMMGSSGAVSYSGTQTAITVLQGMENYTPPAAGDLPTGNSTDPLAGIANLTPQTDPTTGDTSTGPSLKSQFTSAFGDPTDPQSPYSKQLAFLNGLPGSLPKNSGGYHYDPGNLSPDKEALIQQLVASGKLNLGKTPDQLKQDGVRNKLINAINTGNAPQNLGASVDNQTGSFADFGVAVTTAQSDLDSLGDLTTDMQMRLQLEQSAYSQIMEALSNIMKSMSQTSQTLVENLKT